MKEKIKVYFKGGKGILNPVDVNGIEIKKGDILTCDWFNKENPIQYMRDMFSSMKDWTDKEISDNIHAPCILVKWNNKGFFYGEGIEEKKYGRLYMHDFCFKHTKKITSIKGTMEQNQKISQIKNIISHLETHGSINPLEALNLYGCFRLASRMNDLKNLNIEFTKTMKESNGKRFAEYLIVRN